jgi:uncharacterized membrane protein
MASVGGVCFVFGGFFIAIGAWPVFGFLGLDVLIVYLAFGAASPMPRCARSWK